MLHRHFASRPVTRLLLACLVGLTACGDKSEADLLSSARQYSADKNNDAAIVELKTLLQGNPASGEGRFLLGKYLLERGDFTAAEAELARALEAGHPADEVLPQLAGALLAQGKDALLLSQYGATVLRDGQADAELKTHLAVATARQGDLEQAQVLLQQAQQKASDPTVVMLQRARLAATGGDRAAAMGLVQDILQRQPNNDKAWSLQGELLASGPSPQVDEALSAWRKSLALRPDAIGVHSAIIAALMERKDWPGANAQWALLKKVAAAHPQTAYFEALLAEQRGDDRRTREIAQQLLRNAPDNLRVVMLAGRSELRLGSAVQAETLFAKAMQIAPAALVPRRALAQAQLRNGQPDKALLTVKPMLESNPPDTEGLLIAAQAHLQQGNSQAAALLYTQAAKLSPTDLRVRTAAAIVQLSKGQEAAAFKELQAVAALDTSVSADLALINGKMRRGAFEDALKAIDVMAAKAPKEPQADYLRARIALQKKSVPQARQFFAAALGHDPEFMPALMGLVTLDLMDKQPETAKSRLESVVQRNDKHVGALLVLAELNDRAGGSADESTRWLKAAVAAAPADPAPRLKLIDHLLRANQENPALEEVQTAIALMPNDFDLLDRLGRIQLLRGETAQSLITFNKMAGLQPQSPLPYLRQSMAQSAAGDKKAASVSVRRAIDIAPDDLNVQRAAIELALAEGQPARALAQARNMQSRDKPGGLVLEGNIEAGQKNWPAAAVAYRKALALAPETESALRLYQVLQVASKPAEARQLVVDWRKSHPADLAFLIRLGDWAMASKQAAQAERFYREALAQNPGHLLALNNLVYAVVGQKKPGGVALAEQAVKLAPQVAPFQDTLAFALAAENQFPRAVEVQTRAVELAPNAPQYRLQLARLHLKAGDKDAAKVQLDWLDRLGPQFSRQGEVKALQKLLGR